MQMYANEYQSIGANSEVYHASAHRLTQMLFEGCLRFMYEAKFHIEEKQISEKAEKISKALNIVMSLRGSLQHSGQTPIADDLAPIYEFVERHLVQANLHNSLEELDECISIMSTLKSGWDAMDV
jgi:flagellar protein FliS